MRSAAPACDWDLIAGTGRGRRRPAKARRRVGLLRSLLALPLMAGAIIVLVALAQEPRGGAPDVPFEARHVPAAPASVWAALDPASTPFSLAPEDASPIPASAARASEVLGLREDVFSLGAFAQPDAPFLRLALVTATREGASPPEAGESAYVALVRRAAETDGLAVGRVTGRTTLATGFGALDLLDVTLSGATSRACTALRLQRGTQSVLALDGYVCGPADSLPEAASLGCLVDRLSVRGKTPAVLTPAFAAAVPRRAAACRGVDETASTTASPIAEQRKGRGAAPHAKPPR